MVLRAVSRAPPANLPSPSRDGCPPLARVRNGGREPWPFEVQWVTVPGHQVNGRAGVLLPLTPSPARPRPTAPGRASPCQASHDTTVLRPRRTVSNLNYVPGQVVPNAVTVGLGSDGAFNIYALTNLHFITDLAGYFAP